MHQFRKKSLKYTSKNHIFYKKFEIYFINSKLFCIFAADFKIT